MVKRQIINIDEEKCNGCKQCIPNCPEGALQIIDGKARLVSDLMCDGLGACIGHCPQDAITFEEREAKEYDENKVMENIVRHGDNTIKAHLKHLKDHGQTDYLDQAYDYLDKKGIKIKEEKLPCGCPGTAMREVKEEQNNDVEQTSALRQWPVQLNLLPPHAPLFDNSDLLICADCVPFAEPNFHSKYLRGKSVVVGCPKLDDINSYEEKITEIIKNNNIKSLTVAIMEVPCCYGLYAAVENALEKSGKKVLLNKEIIRIQR